MKKENPKDDQNLKDYRDAFSGIWQFNGKRTTTTESLFGGEDVTKNENISNFIGTISKPSWPYSEVYPNRIIINYMKGSSEYFDIDSVGKIFNYMGGSKLGQVNNQNSLTLNWESESDGMNESETSTTVNLTAVKQ